MLGVRVEPAGRRTPTSGTKSALSPPPWFCGRFLGAAIADYASIGNLRTAALVGRDGSIDWLCVPRFDDAACFCALLGAPEQGRWLLAPARAVRRATRRYRDRTLILETEFETSTGAVCVTDFMPTWHERTDVVRIVTGLRGRVPMRMELVLRFGYGSVIPWVRRVDGALLATSGPHSAEVRAGVDTHGEDFRTVADFTVGKRRAHAVRDHVLSIARAAAAAHRSIRDARRGADPAGCMVHAMHVRRPLGRRRRRARAYAQEPHPRTDRGDRRRADHVASRADRRHAELGLPLLLGARCDVHAVRTDVGRLSG